MNATAVKSNVYSKKLNQFGVFGGNQRTPNQKNYGEEMLNDMLQQERIPTGKNSAVDILLDQANSQNTSRQGDTFINDKFNSELRLVSEIAKATGMPLISGMIDTVANTRHDLRSIAFGDSTARTDAISNLGLGLAVGGAIGVAGKVTTAVLPAFSRISFFGGSSSNFASLALQRGEVDLLRGVGGESATEKTVRFTELASSRSKVEVRSLLKSDELNLPAGQVKKLLEILGSGRMDNINIKLMPNGEVRLAAERAGYSNGYQRMSFEVDQLGRTNKVVQTAFDDANKLVPQRPGEYKNNLYDVKKWTK